MIVKVDPATMQTLHRVLRQKTDLTDRIRRGPKQTEAAENAQKASTADLESTKEQLKSLKMAADEKQLQLGGREAKIDDLKAKRNACDSNRDFQLLTEQIAADEAANLVLSDEILELLEKIDQQDETVKAAEEKLEAVKKETERIRSDVEAKLGVLENDLALVEKELGEIEASLPGEMKAEYRRLADANGEDALAALDDKCCGKCYTILSPQVLDQLRMTQSVTCGSCGSFIYIPQNDSVAS